MSGRPRVVMRVVLAVVLIALVGFGSYRLGRHFWARSHLQEAQRDIEAWRFQDAYAHLTRCREVWPDDAATLFLAARTARRAGLYRQADEHLAQYQKREGITNEYSLERALLQVQQGDMEGSEQYLRATITPEHPDAALVLEALAKGYLANDNLSALAECTTLWLQVRPDDTHALFYRGLAFEHAGDNKKAADSFRKAIETDDANADAHFHLGRILLEDFNRAGDALEHMERFRAVHPDDPEGRLGVARCKSQLGEREEAEQLLDQVLAVNPRSALAWAERGKLALRGGNAQAAEPSLRRAVELSADDRETLYALITCLEELKKVDEVKALNERLAALEADLKHLDEITRAAVDQPKDAAIRLDAAKICFKYSRENEGLRWLSAALRIDPDNKDARNLAMRHAPAIGKTRP
jgi:tetratricopeptide (TPR) repeat protein